MDVEHPAVETRDELRAEDAHETREHDEIRLRRLDRRGERGIEVFARGIGLVRDDERRHALRAREIRARDRRPIADDSRDRPAEAAIRARR
jgi:hypothetical protein